MSLANSPQSYNGSTNGHMQYLDTHPYPPVDHDAWKQERAEEKRNAWQAQEPAYLHSMKWHADGVEHMTVVRASDLDSLWKDVRVVTQLIRASRAKEATHSQEPVQGARVRGENAASGHRGAYTVPDAWHREVETVEMGQWAVLHGQAG